MVASPVGPRLVVALDFADANAALAFAARLNPGQCRVKVGKELFTRAGPRLIEELQARGFDVFLDLKYHDIPQTVAAACRAAADLGVWMVNVHASGGSRMLAAAREAVDGAAHRPWLIAVTLLTSIDRAGLAELGCDQSPEQLVERLAGLACRGGCDGVVCSAREAGQLRARHGPALMLVTPGIRPATATPDDQRRVVTAAGAITAGADVLVVGRPITAASDPVAALQALQSEVEAAGPGS